MTWVANTTTGKEMAESFNALKEKVDNIGTGAYVEVGTLPAQTPTNNDLGELAQLSKKDVVVSLETATQMQAEDIEVGATITTEGLQTANDGFGSVYKILDSSYAHGSNDIVMNDGKKAVLLSRNFTAAEKSTLAALNAAAGGIGGVAIEALDHATYRVLGSVDSLVSADKWRAPLDTFIKSIDCYAGILTGSGSVTMKLHKNNSTILETITLNSSTTHVINATDYAILTTDILHWSVEVVGDVDCQNLTGRIKYVL